jgi:hypothetical protein
MTSNTPVSSHGRFNEDGDWVAQQVFSSADLQMSPEEYAARHAHLLGCFSLHFYRYRDPVLSAWVRRLAEIHSSEDEIERCRQKFLTPEELATVRSQEGKGF